MNKTPDKKECNRVIGLLKEESEEELLQRAVECMEWLMKKTKAKRVSTKNRAKDAENRVSKYLWGHLRDWKEFHDVSGNDDYGTLWYGCMYK